MSLSEIQIEVNEELAKNLHMLIIRNKGIKPFTDYMISKEWKNSEGVRVELFDIREAGGDRVERPNGMSLYLFFEGDDEPMIYPFYYSRVVGWFKDFLNNRISSVEWKKPDDFVTELKEDDELPF